MQHLIKAGCKNIAAFAVSPFYVSSIKERTKGYLAAMKDAGFNCNGDLLVEIPFDKVKSSVKKMIVNFTQPSSRIDAIFAINNNIAVACLETFRELKIKIPKDMAFIAFDDIDAFKITSPQVTAIDQPLQEICLHAVSILISEIKKYKNAKKEIILKPKLILRESV